MFTLSAMTTTPSINERLLSDPSTYRITTSQPYKISIVNASDLMNGILK
jgi:hypothetical protein